MPDQAQSEVFVSYSHKDRKWKDRVVEFMESLAVVGLSRAMGGSGEIGEVPFRYTVWSDEDIKPGDRWEGEIMSAIDRANVAILLVSVDFLCSEFIRKCELPKLMERESEGQMVVIPLLVRPSLWDQHQLLSRLQAYPSEGRSLAEMDQAAYERELCALMQYVNQFLEQAQDSEASGAEEEQVATKTLMTESAAATADTPSYAGPLYEGEFRTRDGIRALVDQSGRLAEGESVRTGLLLFRTRAQRTWIAVTQRRLVCVLDSEKTRNSGRMIQWTMLRSEARPVRVRDKSRYQNSGLVDIGTKRNWLYSKRLHPDRRVLEEQLTGMIDDVRRG